MKLKLHIVIAFLAIPFSINAQNDIYWSGGSSLSGNISEASNWFGVTAPNSGDNLYFNNTIGIRDFVYSDYGNESYFNYFITYNGANGIKLYGNNTYAKKFENNNDENLLELSPDSATNGSREIGNRTNSDLEINPVGNGGILVSCDKISMDNLNGTRSLKVYGTNTLTINAVIYEQNGSGSTLQLLNGATVELKGNSIFTGLTTVTAGILKLNAVGGALKSGNAVTVNGGVLRVMQSQTIGNLTLSSGTIQVDSGVTLTITGNYTATGGTIDNKGSIKLAGGSVTFPDSANINNGITPNTMAGFESASTGIVTLNSLVRITNTITVSTGTLLLSNNLHLNNASFNIVTGATFDNGGENQIINDGGTPVITISGTFITRDKDGFVGTNTSIPSITPTLNTGSTIEYGLNGDQAVQGGRSYYNLIFSNSGIKTISSAITNSNTITGMVTIKNAAILDVENKSFGGSGTNLTMTGTSEFRTAGTGVKPDAGGTYTLGIGTTISFTNIAGTLESIRLAPIYANIEIVGSSVGTNTLTGGIDFQSGGTLRVKSSGTFKLSNTSGFSGGTKTAISNVNTPTIILESGSTIEYAGVSQTITPFSPSYSNLSVSGTGIKTTNAASITINNDLNIIAAQLTIDEDQTFVVSNKVNNSGGILIIENNGSLVQVNDIKNTGNITYKRTTPKIIRTDYTYWSSPVTGYTLGGVSQNLTLSDRYYSFDSTIGNWKQESTTTVMNKGIGYIIRGPESPFWAPFNASFIGVPNNGSFSIPGVAANKSYLIGNPYPSALDADLFLIANAGVLDGTLYFWTHNTPIGSNVSNPGSGYYAYSGDDYASYNLTGGAGTTASALTDPNHAVLVGSVYVDQGNKPTGKIASGQGFFASSKNSISRNTIDFNNAMRVGINATTGNNSQFFKTSNSNTKTTTVEKNRIWLNLTNTQGSFKQTLIGYITDATNDYDNLYDGLSFDGNKFVDFYSVNHQKNLVIQGRALPFDENDEVPLGYKTAIGGTFTIAIDQTDGALSNQAAFIVDKLTNTIFDLKSGDYTFNTDSGTFNDRFVLKYTNKTLANTNIEIVENKVFVSNKNKQIKVNSSVDIIDTVTVYDLLGKLLFKKVKINSNELKIPNLISSQQTLLVIVYLQNGQSITKKILF